MSKIRKVAFIGAGRVAAHHCKMLTEVPEMELAAVCDLNEERGRPLAEQYGVQWYDNYHQMLSQRSDIDIVTIATPSGMHHEHTMDIISRYGKNIIVEKPTFMRPEQMRAAYDLAESKGAKIFAVYQNRYNKAVRFVKEAVISGLLGEIRMASVRMRWCRPQRYYDRDPWRGTWSHDGGALTNQGVHYLDILRYLGGEVKSVNAIAGTLAVDVEVEDAIVATFEFQNGGMGVIEVTTAARPVDFEASISVVGSEGLAVVAGEATNHLITFSPDPSQCEANSEDFEIVYGYGHREMYKDIADVLNRNDAPPVSFDDGMRTLALLHGIYKSAEVGGWIDISETNQSDRLGRPDDSISDLYRTPAP
ncbi:MAG: Gfo/Idh/MocA family oxidoreductase [Rhodospirillales bacterium]|nr:Gfo/Idh/MocA family oxidoreductase [Rhodospirillales bacterium]